MLSARLTIIAFLAATWGSTAYGEHHYDVACPGVNSELHCPEGQVIEVLAMNYGEKSSADCVARDHPGKVLDEEKVCLHPMMIGWVQFICDNMQRCRLPKPHKDMFECDHAENFFVQITYDCHPKSPEVHTEVVCEGHEKTLKCEKGNLHILKASYGRFNEEICTEEKPSTMTFCSSQTADYAMHHMCDGEHECHVKADSDVLGEPMFCDDLPKYLTVDYVCE